MSENPKNKSVPLTENPKNQSEPVQPLKTEYTGGFFEAVDASGNWHTLGSNVKGKPYSIYVSDELDGYGNPTGSKIAAIAENAIIPGTGAVTIPHGTTAQRPYNPTLGMIRVNSDSITLNLTFSGFPMNPNPLVGANASEVDKNNIWLGTYLLMRDLGPTFTLVGPTADHQTISVTNVAEVSDLHFPALGMRLRWPTPQDFTILTQGATIIVGRGLV